MRRPWLLAVAWPLLMLWNLVCPILLTTSSVVGVVVANKETYDNNEARLRVTVMTDAMVRVPSCQHKFSQIELLNLVRCSDFVSLWLVVQQLQVDNKQIDLPHPCRDFPSLNNSTLPNPF